MPSNNRFELSIQGLAGLIARFRAFEPHFQEEAKVLTYEAGELTREVAQQICPVDTAFMRDHIQTRYADGGLTFEVGWDAADFFNAGEPFYPVFVTLGTSKMAARPVLEPAYAEVRPGYVAELSAALVRSVEDFGRAAV